MPNITNKAGGPRVVHLRQGEGMQAVTLAPGQSVEGELANPEGRVEQAWIEAGELEIGGKKAEAPARAVSSHADDPAGPEAVARAAMDSDRRTPPKQFGGDGGPRQMPTVDGNDGAPTPAMLEGAPKADDVRKAEEARREELKKASAEAQKEEQSLMQKLPPQSRPVSQPAQQPAQQRADDKPAPRRS